MLEFLDGIKNHTYISDIISNGNITDSQPKYLSGKLKGIFETNSSIWKNYNNLKPSEREQQRQKAKDLLRSNFKPHCKAGSNADSLLNFATTASDPTFVSKTKKIIGDSITPVMAAMLTAAKLYWSPEYISDSDPSTHPPRESIINFLKWTGITEQNTASAAATIIRPEKATAGNKRLPHHDKFFGPGPDLLRANLRRSKPIYVDPPGAEPLGNSTE